MLNLKEKKSSKPVFIPARLAFAFDVYSLGSKFLGNDANGRLQFDTNYTEMGKLVHDLKFYQHRLTVGQILKLVNQIIKLLLLNEQFMGLLKDVGVIIPVPPSKKIRSVQPTFAVAQAISNVFGIPSRNDFVHSSNTEEVKGMDVIDRYDIVKKGLRITSDAIMDKKTKILLLDDVLDSGSTIKAVLDTLAGAGYEDISFFTLTIKRTSGLE